MYNSGGGQKPQALENTHMKTEHNSHSVTKSELISLATKDPHAC